MAGSNLSKALNLLTLRLRRGSAQSADMAWNLRLFGGMDSPDFEQDDAEIAAINRLFRDGCACEATTRWTRWNEVHPEDCLVAPADGPVVLRRCSEMRDEEEG